MTSALRAIDRIVRDTIKDPVGPEFMAPPSRGSSNREGSEFREARDHSDRCLARAWIISMWRGIPIRV